MRGMGLGWRLCKGPLECWLLPGTMAYAQVYSIDLYFQKICIEVSHALSPNMHSILARLDTGQSPYFPLEQIGFYFISLCP